MAEAFLDAGLLMCDLAYTLLEMVRAHYFPPDGSGRDVEGGEGATPCGSLEEDRLRCCKTY